MDNTVDQDAQLRAKREEAWQSLLPVHAGSRFPDLRLSTPTLESLPEAVKAKVADIHEKHKRPQEVRDRAEQMAREWAGTQFFLFKYASAKSEEERQAIADAAAEPVRSATPGMVEEVWNGLSSVPGWAASKLMPDTGLTTIKDATVDWLRYAGDQFKGISGINLSTDAVTQYSHDQLLELAYATIAAEEKVRGAKDKPKVVQPVEAGLAGWQTALHFLGAAFEYIGNAFGNLIRMMTGEKAFNTPSFAELLEARKTAALSSDPRQKVIENWDQSVEEKLVTQKAVYHELVGKEIAGIKLQDHHARLLTAVDSRGQLVNRRLPGTKPGDADPLTTKIAERYDTENPSLSERYHAMTTKYGGEGVVLATGAVTGALAWHVVKPFKRTGQIGKAGLTLFGARGGEAKGLARAGKIAFRGSLIGVAAFSGYEAYQIYSKIWESVDEGKITSTEASELYSLLPVLALENTVTFDSTNGQITKSLFSAEQWNLVKKAGLEADVQHVFGKTENQQILEAYQTLENNEAPSRTYAGHTGTIAGALGYTNHYRDYTGVQRTIARYLKDPETNINDPLIVAIRDGSYKAHADQEFRKYNNGQAELASRLQHEELNRFAEFLEKEPQGVSSDTEKYKIYQNLLSETQQARMARSDGTLSDVGMLQQYKDRNGFIKSLYEEFREQDKTNRETAEQQLRQAASGYKADGTDGFAAFLKKQQTAIEEYQRIESQINAQGGRALFGARMGNFFGDDRAAKNAQMRNLEQKSDTVRDSIAIAPDEIKSVESKKMSEAEMLRDLNGQNMGPARRQLFHLALENGIASDDEGAGVANQFHEDLRQLQIRLALSINNGSNNTAIVPDGLFTINGTDSTPIYISQPTAEEISQTAYRNRAQSVLYEQVRKYDENIATNFGAAHFELGLVDDLLDGHSVSDKEIDMLVSRMSVENVRQALDLIAPVDPAHPLHNKMLVDWAKANNGNQYNRLVTALETDIATILGPQENGAKYDIKNLVLNKDQWEKLTKEGSLGSGLRPRIKEYLVALRDSKEMRESWQAKYKETALGFVETTAALRPFAQDLAQSEYAIRDLFMFPTKEELDAIKAKGNVDGKWAELLTAAQKAQEAFRQAYGDAKPEDVKLLLDYKNGNAADRKRLEFFTGAFKDYFDLYRTEYLGVSEQVRMTTQQAIEREESTMAPGDRDRTAAAMGASYKPMSFSGFTNEELQAMLHQTVAREVTSRNATIKVQGSQIAALTDLANTGVTMTDGGQVKRSVGEIRPSGMPKSLSGAPHIEEAMQLMS